jgi:hypothetical protein
MNQENKFIQQVLAGLSDAEIRIFAALCSGQASNQLVELGLILSAVLAAYETGNSAQLADLLARHTVTQYSGSASRTLAESALAAPAN